ncbi:hypothetical protein KUCAC02_012853 [Chaenocephalus aceratus]|uniref:Uncharacterized protein n=1 Tax=Chaenocephalus aceratus TaxID=36190 RepID=A0ACB9XBT3_CHAAC|nr:hypothetical protein KUCAC02_012853 [Chaenocephalus aceratus]
MLDVALLMANASQLKAVMEQGPNLSFYTPIITLISISLCLQVAVGVLLIFTVLELNMTGPVGDRHQRMLVIMEVVRSRTNNSSLPSWESGYQ